MEKSVFTHLSMEFCQLLLIQVGLLVNSGLVAELGKMKQWGIGRNYSLPIKFIVVRVLVEADSNPHLAMKAVD